MGEVETDRYTNALYLPTPILLQLLPHTHTQKKKTTIVMSTSGTGGQDWHYIEVTISCNYHLTPIKGACLAAISPVNGLTWYPEY